MEFFFRKEVGGAGAGGWAGVGSGEGGGRLGGLGGECGGRGQTPPTMVCQYD